MNSYSSNWNTSYVTRLVVSAGEFQKYNLDEGTPLEERNAINSVLNLEKNATETYGMLQTAFRASCMKQFWVA